MALLADAVFIPGIKHTLRIFTNGNFDGPSTLGRRGLGACNGLVEVLIAEGPDTRVQTFEELRAPALACLGMPET